MGTPSNGYFFHIRAVSGFAASASALRLRVSYDTPRGFCFGGFGCFLRAVPKQLRRLRGFGFAALMVRGFGFGGCPYCFRKLISALGVLLLLRVLAHPRSWCAASASLDGFAASGFASILSMCDFGGCPLRMM